MGKLFIMDWSGAKYQTDIDLDDIEYMMVNVVTGDEILYIHMKDGTDRLIDSSDYMDSVRAMDCYDGSYSVKAKDLQKWSERKNTYSYWED